MPRLRRCRHAALFFFFFATMLHAVAADAASHKIYVDDKADAVLRATLDYLPRTSVITLRCLYVAAARFRASGSVRCSSSAVCAHASQKIRMLRACAAHRRAAVYAACFFFHFMPGVCYALRYAVAML